jgi:putative ABC transport system permease protein
MLAPRLVPLVLKQIWRQRTRSLLTIAGVTIAMFLFSAVQAMQAGVESATQTNANDTTLVVYRKDRYCPFASRMPQSYVDQIARIPGVASVVPIKIVVSNCRTSLDVVTFRGVPKEPFAEAFAPKFQFRAGSLAEWQKRSDAVLLGETLAQRRGLAVGDRFSAAGITAYVAGVIHADEPQHDNVAYAHLDFLQYEAGSRAGGIVTQFNVKVTDPSQLEAVAKAIDAEFAAAQEPTQTSPEKEFVARAASDVIEIVGFMRYLGLACLAAVLTLVANAIILSVQDRIREHAVLRTLGYKSGLIARLIVSEGLVLSLTGALVGCVLAVGTLQWGAFALSVDGLSIPVQSGPAVLGWGLLLATVLGIAAGLVPAWQAARREIVACFRAV